tara:strand:+ start:25150 stop:26199 length:1050 start_codon:yes stop_codon:yes gene_type:complete
MKTGRNDPCPCGSGRKHKYCCIDAVDDRRRTGSGQDIADEIAASAATQPFESLEELNAFTRQLAAERNRSARADFCGLSPEQMSHLLYAPLSSPETVRFAADIEPGPEVEIMALFLALSQAIGETGLKATATGNLPLNFCKSLLEQTRSETDDRRSMHFGGIRSETEFEQLHCTRLVAQLAGLIRKHRGHFVLTRKCKGMLSGRDHGGLYFELFKSYGTQFNWGFRDLYPEAEIVQSSFLYTLFLLAAFGERQRPQKFYEDKFLLAFPMLVDGFEGAAYTTAADRARHCYVIRALDRFARFFGLAELVWQVQGLHDYRYDVSKTVLLDRFVSFAVSTGSAADDPNPPVH